MLICESPFGSRVTGTIGTCLGPVDLRTGHDCGNASIPFDTGCLSVGVFPSVQPCADQDAPEVISDRAGCRRCKLPASPVTNVTCQRDKRSEFYRCFGFSSKIVQRLAAPIAGEAFMAIGPEPGAL